MSGVDDYLDLPEDPELAFVEFERRLRGELWQVLNDSKPMAQNQDNKVTYVVKLMAFHDAHGFKMLTKPTLTRGTATFNSTFDHFSDEVNYWATQIDVRHAQRLRAISTILSLTPEIRQQLHSYVTKIREILLPIELSEKKKEALFGKLNALADEIDRDRTKAEAWTAFTLEVASVGGQAARELKPVKDLADAIGNLFAKAKEMGEKLGLPSRGEQKRIEGPRKQLPAPQADKATEQQSDEIPF